MIGTKIILVGMPGAGKSTFGKHLAAALGYGFLDLDDLIEELSGASIPDLFAVSEEHFREKETQALRHALNQQPSLVVASGGGTPCFNDNMTTILDGGISIFLDPPMSVLLSRTEKEGHRPLLQGSDIQRRLEELYRQRRTYYEQALIKLTTESLDTQGVINLISDLRN